MSEDSTKPEAPNIGFTKVRYGKTRVYQGTCKTCEPEWRGEMHSMRGQAFQSAILHAIKVHKWVPQV